MTQPRPRLSLAHLTALEASPAELVSAAAAAGFDAAGVRLMNPPGIGAPLEPVQPSQVRAVQDRLGEAGISVLDVEAMWIDEQTRASDYHDLFEAAAQLGARNVLGMAVDPDESRLVNTLGQMCLDAAGWGLNVGLEFAVFTAVKTIADAERVVRATGQVNGRIIVDVLHFVRSGGTPAHLATLDTALLDYVQLCDATAEPPTDPADFRLEGRTDRRYPGEGELDLGAIVSSLPDGLPLSIEAPCKAYAHLPIQTQASLAFKATLTLLERLRSGTTPS